MSNSNGYNTLTKSMNGIITLSDGSGTVIEDDTITTDTLNVATLNVGELNAQNVIAPDPTSASSMYINNTGSINIGSLSSNVQIGKYYLYDNSIQYINTTTGINLLTNTTQAISIGSSSSPLIGQYTCTNSTHLANKGYVDSAVSGGSGGLLASNNTWTGLNKFSSTANLQSLTIDESSSGISQLTSRTNTADNTMITNRIRMSSGTSVDNGRMQFYGGLIEWFSFNIRFSNNTATNSMVIDNSTANEVEQLFCTNNASPTTVTATILVSGGTTTNTGNIDITAENLTMNGNLGFTGSLKGMTSNGSLKLFDGDSTSNTGATTIAGLNPSSAPCGSVLVIQYSKVANTTCTLSNVVRDGFYFYLVNQGQGTCTVLYFQASLFGAGLTRGGATSCTIASGGARYFRSCEFPSNTLNGGFTNGWFTTSL